MYMPKTSLWSPDTGLWRPAAQLDHQREAISLSRGRAGFAYFVDMGGGKSRIDLDETLELHCSGEVDGWLILAPKGCYTNWSMEEIPKWSGEDCLDHMSIAVWDGRKTREKKEEINALFSPSDRARLDVLVMNIEALATSDRAFALAREFVRRHRTKITIDESVKIKNPAAQATKSVGRLRDEALYRRVLCGQPVPNGPMDIFSQMDWVVPGCLGRSFFSFRSRYAVLEPTYYGTRRVDQIVDYRDLDDLAQRIAPHSYRKKKEDCLDLPPKIYMPFRQVEMTDQQRRVYREMRETCTAEIEDSAHATATLVITQIMRLHQVLMGHLVDEEGNLHLLDTRRPQAMLDWCEEVRGSGIIWCCYRAELDRLEAVLRKAYGDDSVVRYHGGCSDAELEQSKLRFNDGSARWFLSSQHKGARGLTLLPGRDTLYYANTPGNLDHREQSEDRSHRNGQTGSCTYSDLIVPGTVEEKFVDALRRKIDLASVVMRDGPRAWMV